MTLYDYLGLRFAKVNLSFGLIALSSFISYALSHNLGFALLTGGAARLRLLSRWNVSAADVGKQVAFVSLMFSLGYCLISGLTFIIYPPRSAYLSSSGIFITGIVLLSVVVGFFGLAILRRQPFEFFGIGFPRVPVRMTAAAVFVSALDWILAAAVAWTVFPDGAIAFTSFLGVFLIAQVLGLISNVPGGIGVFEGAMVSALAGKMPADKILGCLLIYRLIYYIVPFILALLVYALYEAYGQRNRVKKVASLIARPSAVMMPAFTTAIVFTAGVVLLISGATPPIGARWRRIVEVMPIGLVEFSHLFGSIVGVGLLIVAHGLWRRVDSAYYCTILLLVAGLFTSVLKALDLEEALLILAILILFIPSKPFFFRRSNFWNESLSPRWIFLILSTLAGAIWCVFFFYKNIDYSHSLWWEFALNSHVSRSMRATLLASLVAFLYLGNRFFSPLVKPFNPPTAEDLALVASIVKESSNTNSSLALLGDKQILFNAGRTGFVMFAHEGRSCISMGDPVGSPEVQEELIWDFYELCVKHGLNCCFYEVSERNLGTFVEVGLNLLKLGEEAHVILSDFGIEGKARASLRSCRNKLSKDGYTFAVVPGPQSDQALQNYQIVSDSWLKHKRAKEKGFSLGFFSKEYIRQFDVAVVSKNDQIVAFANLWTTSNKQEVSVDLMRYIPAAPNGLMDYLFTELFLWAKASQYKQFNLGMAPFSGFEDRIFAPLWNRLGAMLFHHGEHFYNFRGLRTYKEKFDPIWNSRYLAFPSRFSLPLVLSNIASVVSGGAKGISSR